LIEEFLELYNLLRSFPLRLSD